MLIKPIANFLPCVTWNKSLFSTNLGAKQWIKCLLVMRPLLETFLFEKFVLEETSHILKFSLRGITSLKFYPYEISK